MSKRKKKVIKKNNQSQGGFFYIEILAVIVVIVLITTVVFHIKSEKFDDVIKNYIVKTKCPAKQDTLALSPIALKDLSTIIPLGNLAPPGHVLPTTHMYFNYLHVGEGSQLHSVETAIYVPTDMTATRMLKINSVNSFATYDAYRIDFEICEEVSGYFILVQKLNKKLDNAFKNAPGDKDNQNVEIKVKLIKGELLGYGGGKLGFPDGIDFTIMDTRSIKPILANPSRWPESEMYYSCALDYFSPELSHELYAKIGDYSYRSIDPGEPRCGNVYQDVPQTAQGVWVTKDVNGQNLWDSKNLAALVHSNFNHQEGVFSFGNKILEIGINNSYPLVFAPQTTGDYNLDFNLVKDTKIYCYDTDNRNAQPDSKQTILLQLNRDKTLHIGKSDLPCSQTNWQIPKYVEYIR